MEPWESLTPSTSGAATSQFHGAAEAVLRQEGSWAMAAAPKGMVFPEGCTAALGFGAVGRDELKLEEEVGQEAQLQLE